MEKLLLVIPDGIHTGVIESQMFGLAQYYNKDFEVTIAIPVDLRKIAHNINVSFIYYNNCGELTRLIKIFDIIYFRSITNFFRLYPYCKVNSVKIIYDFRGLISFESYNRNNCIPKLILYFILEFTVYLLSNKIQCVSNSMKETLIKYFGKKPIKVIPCMTKDCILRKDCIREKIKFVYVGGLSEWQKIDQVLYTSEYIQNYFNCTFTFITNQPNELEKIILKTKLKNYIVLTGDNSFVVENLKTQDFGFLFRDNLLLNRVASPIKFLEYTSNGVVPIITPYVGDYSTDVLENKLGVIFNNDLEQLIKEISEVTKSIEIFRERLYNYSVSLTWDNNANQEKITEIKKL